MVSYDINAVIKAQDKASATLNKVGNSAKGLSGKLNQLGNAAQVAGGIIVAQISSRAAAAISDFVSSSVRGFADLEFSAAKIVAAMGKTGAEARVLRKEFVETAESMSRRMGVSAIQISGSLESLVKAGLSGADAMKALESSVRLAAIEQIDASLAGDLVVSTLAQFKLGAEAAESSVDALVNASALGIGTASDYASGLAFVGASNYN